MRGGGDAAGEPPPECGVRAKIGDCDAVELAGERSGDPRHEKTIGRRQLKRRQSTGNSNNEQEAVGTEQKAGGHEQ